jgi:hypothetical protein
MKPFVVSTRRAVLGLPYYVAWNLVAHAKGQDDPAEKAKAVVCTIPAVTFITALWAAAWLLILWLILQLAS